MDLEAFDRIMLSIAERVFWQAICAERAAVAQERADLLEEEEIGASSRYRCATCDPFRVESRLLRYEVSDFRRWAREGDIL